MQSKKEFDPLIVSAAELIVRTNEVNVASSLVRNKLKISFAKTSLIMDQLADLGIISLHKENNYRQLLCKDIKSLNEILLKNELIAPNKLIIEKQETQNNAPEPGFLDWLFK